MEVKRINSIVSKTTDLKEVDALLPDKIYNKIFEPIIEHENPSCIPLSNTFNFGINIAVHVLILFSFLTFFYFLFISKVSETAFKTEMENVINSQLPKVLEKRSNSELDKITNRGLKESQIFAKLEQMYNQPSQDIETHNYYVKFITFGTCLMVFLTIALVVTIQYFSCGKCISLWKIVLENVIIFSIIGLIEFLFFTKIAMKFIPAPPSLMMKTAFDALKQTL